MSTQKLFSTTKTLKTSTITVVLQRINTSHLIFHCYWAWATQPMNISYDSVQHIVPHPHEYVYLENGTTYTWDSDGYCTYYWKVIKFWQKYYKQISNI